MKSKTNTKQGGLGLFFKKIGYALKVLFQKLGRFIKRHKVLSIIVGVLLVAGLALLIRAAVLSDRRPQLNGDMMTYVRTVTLSKDDLLETVTVTGTVESADVSSVVASVNNATVKEILVQVGDTVEEGDVILTLDTADLLEQIEKEQTNLATNISNAQDSYDRAVTSRDKAATSKTTAYNAYAAAQSALSSATTPYNTAKSAVAPEQAEYNAAVEAQAVKQSAFSAKAAAFEAALAVCPNGHDISTATSGGAQSCGCAAAYAEWNTAQSELTAANSEVAAKQQALETAKSLANYAAAESAYNAAYSTYTKAASEYESACSAYDSAESSVTSSYKSLQTSKKGETLADLKKELEKYTLTAKSSGTVTYLNATVGGTASGTVATIQDTDNLKIAVSVAEYDIKSVAVGMRCIITSDATDGEIEGIVLTVNPTTSAGMSGGAGGGSGSTTSSTFDAEIAVTGGANGLLVGMNASVDVVLSSTENVFSVPIDAVGTDAQGNSVVYLQSGSENGQPVFAEVVVTTGEQTDYYVEISSASLKEGDVIRASANEDEAAVADDDSAQSTADQTGGMFSFGSGQTMPSGGQSMPSDGAPGGMGGRG